MLKDNATLKNSELIELSLKMLEQRRAVVIQSVFEQAPVGLVLLDADLKYSQINIYAASITGHRPEELIGKYMEDNLTNYFQAEDVKRLIDQCKKTLITGKSFELHGLPQESKFNKYLYWDCQIWCVKDVDRSFSGLLLTVKDITRHVYGHFRLENDLRTLFNAVSDILCIGDLNKIKMVNPSVKSILGYTGEEFCSIDFRTLIHPEDLPSTNNKMHSLAQYECLNKFTNRLRCKDGTYKWLEWNVVQDEQSGLICSVARDITDKKRLEEELEKSNRQKTEILERITDGFVSCNKDWRVTYANKEAQRIGKKSPKELIGRTIWELFPDANKSELLQSLQKTMAEQKPLQVNYYSNFLNSCFEFHAYPSPEGLSVIIHDITERKMMEKQKEEIKKSEEGFLKAFKANPNIQTIKLLRNESYVDVNESFENFTGYKREEVIGRTLADLKICLEPEKYSQMMERIKENGFAKNVELAFHAKSGELGFGLMSSVVIELYGEQCILASTVDITEQKKMEKELDRLDRLNLVGEMAAGIGHEVRNPMTTVRGFLQLLSGKKEFSEHSGHFSLMIEELDRANSIITEFLSLARNKAVDLQKKNINTIIEALYPLIQANAMKHDNYIEIFLSDVPEILLNQKEIRQLILNLVCNGLQAMSPGGKITIKTFTEREEVILAVQDEGKGISPEIIDRIGTPFFTTKENGTGLGLSMCYSIANRHNAKISLDTNPHGTTFFVRFKVV